eukprot:gene9490-biopygen6748
MRVRRWVAHRMVVADIYSVAPHGGGVRLLRRISSPMPPRRRRLIRRNNGTCKVLMRGRGTLKRQDPACVIPSTPPLSAAYEQKRMRIVV